MNKVGSTLNDLLGEKNVEKLQERIVDLICDQIEVDLENSNNYIIDPDYICEEIYDPIILEAKERLKEKYIKKLEADFEKYYQSFLLGKDDLNVSIR